MIDVQKPQNSLAIPTLTCASVAKKTPGPAMTQFCGKPLGEIGTRPHKNEE